MCCSAVEEGEGKPLLKKKKPSPYLKSTIIFMLSSVLSFAMSIVLCYTDGYTAANVGSMVGNALYTIAYILYVIAEKNSEVQETALPLLNSAAMIQHS